MSDYLDDAANYMPGGSEQGWDTSEHYSYEAPGGSSDPSGSNEPYTNTGSGEQMGIMFNNGITGGGGGGNNGGFSVGTPWGSGEGVYSGGVVGRSGGGTGSRSGGGSSSINYLDDIVTRSVTATKAMPTMGALPEVPTYDENRVRGLRQKYAASGINKLRGAVTDAITKSSSVDNPYLRKTLMRSSLEGFGGGLDSVMTGAEGRARTAYDTEYKGKLLNYNNEVNRQQQIFDAAMKDYLGSMQTTVKSSKSNPSTSTGTSTSTSSTDQTFANVASANDKILRLAHGGF